MERVEVVEGGRDRDLVLFLGRERRDRANEVQDPVGVVAITLEGRVMATGDVASPVEDLVNQGVADEDRHGASLASTVVRA